MRLSSICLAILALLGVLWPALGHTQEGEWRGGPALVSTSSPALVTNSPREENKWLRGKHEGWYFYNDEIEPELEPEPEPVPPPPPMAVPQDPQKPEAPKVVEQKAEPPRPKPLSTDWFRQHYDEVLKRAIDDPTPENVKAYLFLQRVILDKSTNFAFAVRSAVYSEPLLDENTRIPLASAMRAAVLKTQRANVEEAFRYISTKGGIWFFFHSGCNFCEWQYPHVKKFCDTYGIKLMPISQDGKTIPAIPQKDVLRDMGQSKRLGIQVVPALALAIPERAEIIVFSQGLLSQEGIEQRLLTAALDRKLLPYEMVESIDIFRRGILTPDQIANAPQDEDPVKLINYIRESLEKSWDLGGKTRP